MPVENDTNKVVAAGNGVATVFSFSPMEIDLAANLKVVWTNVDGTEVELSEGTGAADYIVNMTTTPGTGSITYPASGTAFLLTDETLAITKDMTFTQTVDLKNQGGYHPETLESALNKLTHIAQQIKQGIDGAVQTPAADTIELIIPSEVSRPGKVLGFDSNGQFTTVDTLPEDVTVTPFMETVLDDVDGDAGLTTLGLVANGLALVKSNYAAMRTLLGLGSVYDKEAGITDGKVALLGAGDVFDISLLPTSVHNSEITGTVTYAVVTGTNDWQAVNIIPHGLGYTPDEVVARFVNISGGTIGGFLDGFHFDMMSHHFRWNDSGFSESRGFTYLWDGTNIVVGTDGLVMQTLGLTASFFSVYDHQWRLDWVTKKY